MVGNGDRFDGSDCHTLARLAKDWLPVSVADERVGTEGEELDLLRKDWLPVSCGQDC